MIRVAGLAAVLMMLLTTSTVSAAAKTVNVSLPNFTPAKATIARGGSVVWHNQNGFTHTATSDVPGLWASVTINASATTAPLTFQQAGTFLYHCAIHSQMHGKVAVKMSVSPTTGTTATTFTITLGTAAAPGGFTHDVQLSRNGGAFISLPSTANQTTTFKATSAGTYKIRTRLHPTSGASPAAWSPKATITVN